MTDAVNVVLFRHSPRPVELWHLNDRDAIILSHESAVCMTPAVARKAKYHRHQRQRLFLFPVDLAFDPLLLRLGAIFVVLYEANPSLGWMCLCSRVL